MQIHIEHNIPMPGHSLQSRSSIYPLAAMEVGDSFFVPANETKKPGALQASLGGKARAWALRNRNGHKFATRQVDGGVRVWRTA